MRWLVRGRKSWEEIGTTLLSTAVVSLVVPVCPYLLNLPTAQEILFIFSLFSSSICYNLNSTIVIFFHDVSFYQEKYNSS